jgi:hypothetical protein
MPTLPRMKRPTASIGWPGDLMFRRAIRGQPGDCLHRARRRRMSGRTTICSLLRSGRRQDGIPARNQSVNRIERIFTAGASSRDQQGRRLRLRPRIRYCDAAPARTESTAIPAERIPAQYEGTEIKCTHILFLPLKPGRVVGGCQVRRSSPNDQTLFHCESRLPARCER